MASPSHVPVLLERTLELVAPSLERDDAIFVDATLGLGGHSEAVLRRFEHVRVIGIDRDPVALEHSSRRLAAYGDRVTFRQAVYDHIGEEIAAVTPGRVDAVLFDLGVSSMQLDERERGFSYAHDAPLDMRMDTTTGRTAADVLGEYSAADLARVLRRYGEERFARRIADAIVAEREREPITSSARLVDIVRASIPAAARRTGGNPAKRTFQALRIEVNEELEVLRRALPAAMDMVCVAGRIVALAYHSLEDRLVKQAFVRQTEVDVPPGLPVIPDELQPRFASLTRGAEQASQEEIEHNSRAASVRLRAVERIREAA